MHTFVYYFLHVLGIDTQHSDFYDLWSGPAVIISIAIAYVDLRRQRKTQHDEHMLVLRLLAGLETVEKEQDRTKNGGPPVVSRGERIIRDQHLAND